MTSTTSISVVIPIYNRWALAERAIASVLAQEHPADEILLVNDGSTESIDFELPVSDPACRLITKVNEGPGLARNFGAGLTKSPWIAFLDGDDEWFPGHLAELHRLIGDYCSAKLVGTAFFELPSGADIPGIKVATKRGIADYFEMAARGSAPLFSSSVAVDRDAFLLSGGFGSARKGEDLELWAKMALVGDVALSNATTVVYRRAVGGVMESSPVDLDVDEVSIAGFSPVWSYLNMVSDASPDGRLSDSVDRYMDSVVVTHARIALRNGLPERARQLLRLQRGYRYTNPGLRILSWLPSPVLELGLALGVRVRQMARQRRWS